VVLVFACAVMLSGLGLITNVCASSAAPAAIRSTTRLGME